MGRAAGFITVKSAKRPSRSLLERSSGLMARSRRALHQARDVLAEARNARQVSVNRRVARKLESKKR